MSRPAPRIAWAFPVFLALFVIAWTIRATVGYAFDLAVAPDVRGIYANGLKLALWAVPAAAFAWLVRGEPRLTSLRLGLPALRALPLMTALIVVYLAGVAIDVSRKHAVSLAALGAALAARGLPIFANALPSAFAEEVLFRGLVLTELTERWGFWRANVASSLLFVAMHWPHRIWRGGLSLAVVADAPALMALAVALAFVVWRTGSIWPAVAFHAANNTLTGILA